MTRLALFCMLLGFTTAFAAAPAPKEDKEPAGLRVKKALEESADVVFEKKSLDEIVSFYKNRLRIDVLIDPTAGLDAAEPIFSIVARNGKYRDALRNVLATQGLHYAVVGGGVIIGTEESVLQRQMRQTVSLDANGTSLAAILKNYADETGANIVLDPRQAAAAEAAKVTLKLDDVPLETAVRLATEVGGLRVVRMSNVLFATSDTRAEKLRLDADGPVAPQQSIPGMVGFGGQVPLPNPVKP